MINKKNTKKRKMNLNMDNNNKYNNNNDSCIDGTHCNNNYCNSY